MTNLSVQKKTANIGNSGTGTVTFPIAQTLGNINIVFINAFNNPATSGVVTSVVDTAGNTYNPIDFVTSSQFGKSAGIWLYTCNSILASASNTITVNWSTGNFMDVAVLEYPPIFAIRTHNTTSGGTASPVTVTLTGTNAYDLTIVFGSDEAKQLLVCNIGANSSNLVLNDAPNADTFVIYEGYSDGSSSCNITLGNVSLDNFGVIAVAFTPNLSFITQPYDVATYIGGTVSFSVVAIASAGTLNYQWKINGTNVITGSGGTTATYTSGVLAYSDNGNLYTCSVTDDNGTILSNAGKLHIYIIGTFPWFGA